ncbi:hypothetical protein H2200_013365 [Cladophialophora chaetospira]|uniref:Uncharacterized protein n=1 Tax=Cladophialophora chaetospira TaxID=386627 RepID=A0AA38WW55_9EURO|nr:hypothetical protein H2200_013365 [Cladophialophora chaetospira]
MNSQELANLLSHSMVAPSRAPAGLHHPPSGPVSEPSLSPRQRFQSSIRTLSENPPSRNASTTPSRSPQLQHVSSLRVQRSESPSLTPRTCSWRSSQSTLNTFSDGPQFDTEEREVWGRPSPFRSTNSLVENSFHLRRHEDESPLGGPEKKLRPFGPSSRTVDTDNRPKTRHGPRPGQPNFRLDNGAEQKESIRPSKFAEGSMNDRSAGVSSTWNDHGSLASISGTDESDNETTPRASPQRSSFDIDEFNPQTGAAPTFTQRLFKFGTKNKSRDVAKRVTNKSEQEPQTVRKKKGLRKSMSMWTLHGDKKKTASQVDLGSSSPQKKAGESAEANDIEVLNDRKRRAEEAYAQQFGTKRRKSNVGVATSDDHAPDKPLAAARRGSLTKATPSSGRRRQSSSSSTNFETCDGVSDIDLQKRPSRRELEKENQQLRAMLRQQEEARSRTRHSQPRSPSSRSLSEAPNDATPPRKPSSKRSREAVAKESPTAPPVPALSPERTALKPLSNTRNAVQRKSSHEDLKTITEDVNDRGRSTNQKPRKELAKHSRRASLARGGDLPRAVSMILEQDEESEAEKKTGSRENVNPLKDIPKLNPTPMSSPTRHGKSAEIKIHEDATVKSSGIKKEMWEWPEDVF